MEVYVNESIALPKKTNQEQRSDSQLQWKEREMNEKQPSKEEEIRIDKQLHNKMLPAAQKDIERKCL